MVVGTLSLVQKGQIVFTVHSISYICNDTVPTTTASIASIGLTFLHQRHCPHHHLPLFHYVYHIHWFDLFALKTMPHHHIPLFHCIHCVHWFDLFTPKTLSPPPYTASVTGPPGALLFNRDQRLHQKNHIYCTDFLPQMFIQVKYPMPSIGHHIWQQILIYENIWNTDVTALSEEICLH